MHILFNLFAKLILFWGPSLFDYIPRHPHADGKPLGTDIHCLDNWAFMTDTTDLSGHCESTFLVSALPAALRHSFPPCRRLVSARPRLPLLLLLQLLLLLPLLMD